MKRVICLMLTLLLTLSVFPMQVFAAEMEEVVADETETTSQESEPAVEETESAAEVVLETETICGMTPIYDADSVEQSKYQDKIQKAKTRSADKSSNYLTDVEFNGTATDAQRLWDDTTISGSLVYNSNYGGYDVDWYVFTLKQESLVEVIANFDYEEGYMGIVANNTLYALGECDGYTASGLSYASMSVVLPAGTYYLAIEDDYNSYNGYVAYFNYMPMVSKPTKIVNTIQGSRVYWTSVSTGATYGVWRSTTGKNGEYVHLANTKATNYLDTSVVSGKTYYYAITVVDWHISTSDTMIHSPLSEPMGITFVDTPDITLRVNRAFGIGLGWDYIPAATGYAVYRKSYSGTDAWVRVATLTGADNTKWDDTSVKDKNGTIYKYTVRALYGTTLSGCHNNGRTMARLTSLSISSLYKYGANQAYLKWGTNTKSDGYEVRFMMGSTVVGTSVIGGGSNYERIIKSIPAGYTYKVQIRCYKKVAGVGTFYSAWSTAREVYI